jgi:hypothetical protein
MNLADLPGWRGSFTIGSRSLWNGRQTSGAELIDARRRVGFPGGRTLGRQLLWWLVLVIALTLSIWAVLRFVSPAPPRAIAMSTGMADGAYHHFGQRYQEILRANGVQLELRTSSGGKHSENLLTRSTA